MMPPTRILAPVAIYFLFSAGPALALIDGQEGAVIALHVQAHDTKGVRCSGLDPTLPCSRFRTSWPVHSAADVYLVVARARADLGISGLSCGLAYDAAPGSGVDVFGTTLCADLEYPNEGPNGSWPASLAGNRILWLRTIDCQRTERETDGVHAVACGFYVYAYGSDAFRVDLNRNLDSGPELLVVDCTGPADSHLDPSGAEGVVGFGGESGLNPCLDNTPPELVGASGAPGGNSITLEFNELMGDGASTAANYTVYPTLVSWDRLQVTSAVAAGSRVTLTLASTLAPATRYSVRVLNVKDLAGNRPLFALVTSFDTGGADVEPPVLLGAGGVWGTNRVTTEFNELVTEGAADPSHYSLRLTLAPQTEIPVETAVVRNNFVALNLGADLGLALSYTLTVSGIEDLAGNVMDSATSIEFVSDEGKEGQGHAVIALHVRPHDVKGLDCGGAEASPACDAFAGIWPLHTPADVYLVVAKARADLGVSGVSCGISYDPAPGQGCDVLGWSLCAGAEDPVAGPNGGWPAAGSGNRITWDPVTDCQRTERDTCGVHAVACGFYVYAYSADTFAVTRGVPGVGWPPGEFRVRDCAYGAYQELHYPGAAGKIGFGIAGYNPCASSAVPTVRTTWGKLKNQYR